MTEDVGIASLRTACERHGIQNVALIDDVFDPPAAGLMNRDRYEELAENWNQSPELALSVRKISHREVQELPAYDDLDDDSTELAAVWRTICESTLKPTILKIEIRERLKTMFLDHDHDPLAMLLSVTDVVSFFKKRVNCRVSYHGSDPDDAQSLARSDLVVVDFFLTPGSDVDVALTDVTRVVNTICDAAQELDCPKPSFLLMSSRPNEVLPDRLREEAGLMKARFRFISKENIKQASALQLMGVHDIIEAGKKTEHVETLINDWAKAANLAVEEVRKQFLRFDISDYVYLDAYRLYNEGVSLSSYLRWLMGAYLEAQIPRNLTSEKWKSKKPIKLFDLEIDPQDPKKEGIAESGLLNAYAGLTEAVAHAYGDIVFDETRSAGKAAFPGTPLNNDLVEGDLFVQRRRGSSNLDGQPVKMILTPTCDLLVRGGEAFPNSKRVLFLEGTLRRLYVEQKRLSDLSYIQVRSNRSPGSRPPDIYEIEWAFKGPSSLAWETISKSGSPDGFVRLGRIREPQFFEIRAKFAQELTRIGREVSPPYPAPQQIEVHFGHGPNKLKIIEESNQSGIAWLFLAGKKKIVHLDRRLIEMMTDAVRRAAINDAMKQEVVEQLEKFDIAFELTKPAKFGSRGPQNFCKIVDATKEQELTRALNSNSRLVILIGTRRSEASTS